MTTTQAALLEALNWYAEQARLCRLIHSEGDAGRHALAADGGERARAALRAADAAQPIAAQAGERAWLVELSTPGHAPQWWGFNHSPRSRGEWCADSNSAVRFARRLDAERMRLHIIAAFGFAGQHSYERSVSVTEHEWGSAAAQAGPVTAEQHFDFTPAELQDMRRNPYVLAQLMNYHDVRQSEADAMFDGDVVPLGNERRWAALYERGRSIMAEDLDVWPDDLRKQFGFPVAAQAGPALVPLTVEALTDKIAELLRGTYHCTRVWEAWSVGTMSQDDFEPVDESETPREIAETLHAMIGAQAPASTRPADASISGQRVDTLPAGWREIVEQLIACHDEPTCPAVAVAKEWLAAAPQAPAPTPAHHVVDLFDAYKQACNLVEWANAAGTMMESPQALYEAAAALRDTLGRATHIAPQAPAEPAAQAVEQDAARDTRKLCTCDGAGRGPGRACVVKAGGRLGELWRCAEGATPAAREAGKEPT